MAATPEKTKNEKRNKYLQAKSNGYVQFNSNTNFISNRHSHTHAVTENIHTRTHTYSSYKHRYSIRSYIFTVVLNIFFIGNVKLNYVTLTRQRIKSKSFVLM